MDPVVSVGVPATGYVTTRLAPMGEPAMRACATIALCAWTRILIYVRFTREGKRMRWYDETWIGKEGIAANMRRMSLSGVLDSTRPIEEQNRYINKCTGVHRSTGSQFLFTRDTGMHSSGWFKNPDYEQCWHLSLSFRDPETGARLPYDNKLSEQWVKAFFGDWTRYIWMESPFSAEGKQCDVWHHRVFCDPAWQPLIPRGEVYDREFTEKGWLSWSDARYAEVKGIAL